MIHVEAFFDNNTFTVTYLVCDLEARDAICIDPVYDYDQASGSFETSSYKKIKEYINSHNLKLHYVLETHVHADHISSSQLIKRDFPDVRIAISSAIIQVQETFSTIFNQEGIKQDGSQFDLLLNDQDSFKAGSLDITVIATPGHTPACLTYHIEDCLFTGDAIFMPDMGTGRCDFPDGDARKLFKSIQKLYQLPDETKVYVGHDYAPGDREEYSWQTTIGAQKSANIQLQSETSEEDFVTFRENRDAQLSAPKLLFPSIQINMNAGLLPSPEKNGRRYIKIPLEFES